MHVLNKILQDERKSHLTYHITRQVNLLNFSAAYQILDCVHAIFANCIIGEIELREAE